MFKSLNLTGDEETQVAVAQHSSNSDQTSPSTGDDAYVLPRILTLPPLAVVLVVQLRNRLAQGPDTSRWAILPAMSANIHLLRPLKAALYAIVDLRRALPEVRPFFGVVEEAVLVRLFGGPYDACRGASSVEAGVGLVAFVRLAELPVDVRAEFYMRVSACRARACGTRWRCDWRRAGRGLG